MYPSLLKKCLLDIIYEPQELFTDKTVNQHSIVEGTYYPKRAHTMIGMKRLQNIQDCFEDVIRNDIEGDLIETGVWRGGATIFMKGLVDFYGVNRKVFVADSFEGLPPPDPSKYPADKGDKHSTYKFLSVSLEEVKENFR